MTEKKETVQTTKSTVGTHETGAVEHERVAQPEINLGREREFETGKDEAWASIMLQVVQNAITTSDMVAKVAVQAMNNKAETDNQVGKQAIKHGDIATDHQWNIDEQANMAAIIASVVAKVLADMAGTE